MADPEVSSKQRLVDAAVELVLDHHRGGVELRTAFGYLTPGAVARRAGLSRALIYHHWGEGEDAVSELLGVVAGRVWRLGTDLDGVAAATEALRSREPGDAPLTLADVVVALAGFEIDRLVGDLRPATRAMQTLMLNGLVGAEEVETFISGVAGLYEALGDELGLEPVPPLGWEDLAFAVSTVAEGFGYGVNLREEALVREFEWSPAGADATPSPGWNLYGVIVESMLRRMVRPRQHD